MLRIIGWLIARARWAWHTPERTVRNALRGREFEDNQIAVAQTDWAERADADRYLTSGVFTAPIDTPPPGYKVFEDGQIGRDISDLDVTDVEELRRVYGPAGIIPDAKLVEWAREARESNQRAWEIRSRLEEISRLPVDEPGDDGYRPAVGLAAGASPKTGVVLPPAVRDLTVKEWADLRLEQAYGLAGMPRFPGQAQGFSMRHLNILRIRAVRRDPSLSAYDLAILRSRGLV